MTQFLGEGTLGVSLDGRTSTVIALATAAVLRDEAAIKQTVADALAAGVSNNEILDVMTVAARVQQSINLTNILQGMQGAQPAAPPPTAVAAPPPRRRGRPLGSRNVRSRAATPDSPPADEAPPAAVAEIPAAFSSRDDFLESTGRKFPGEDAGRPPVPHGGPARKDNSYGPRQDRPQLGVPPPGPLCRSTRPQ